MSLSKDLSSSKLRHNVRPNMMQHGGKKQCYVSSIPRHHDTTHTKREKDKRNNKPQPNKWVTIHCPGFIHIDDDLKSWPRRLQQNMRHTWDRQTAQPIRNTLDVTSVDGTTDTNICSNVDMREKSGMGPLLPNPVRCRGAR